ncbi:BTAD domain-containing putative transcriptional regulator [Nonomuraea sp. NPDC050556]|uniref:AfsR/SARP family transcriptional regulator n=1 Tax=Nonomuraea sp. NPDC050556 TaxID=3364369 RepID=UPI0037A9AC7C
MTGPPWTRADRSGTRYSPGCSCGRARERPRTSSSTAGGGYALGDCASDAEEFAALVRRAEGQEARQARDTLARALRLWREPALGGVPGPFAEVQRVALEETRRPYGLGVRSSTGGTPLTGYGRRRCPRRRARPSRPSARSWRSC